MKKTLLLATALFCISQIADAQSYYFNKSTAVYTELVAPTVIATAGWSNQVYPLTLPFPFTVWGSTGTSVSLIQGSLHFPTPGDTSMIDSYWTQLDDNGSSVVSRKTEGSAPNRIYKIQWKNVGFYWGDSTDFANFQLWLYEGSNTIEMHYGPVTVNPLAFAPFSGAGVGIINFPNDKTFYINGSPSNPVVAPESMYRSFLNGHPSDGTVYTFGYWGVGISEETSATVNVHPNPFSSELSIEIKDPARMTSVKLSDLQGKLLMDENVISQSDYSINTESIPAGIYMLMMTNGIEVLTKKIVKN